MGDVLEMLQHPTALAWRIVIVVEPVVFSPDPPLEDLMKLVILCSNDIVRSSILAEPHFQVAVNVGNLKGLWPLDV